MLIPAREMLVNKRDTSFKYPSISAIQGIFQFPSLGPRGNPGPYRDFELVNVNQAFESDSILQSALARFGLPGQN